MVTMFRAKKGLLQPLLFVATSDSFFLTSLPSFLPSCTTTTKLQSTKAAERQDAECKKRTIATQGEREREKRGAALQRKVKHCSVDDGRNCCAEKAGCRKIQDVVVIRSLDGVTETADFAFLGD